MFFKISKTSKTRCLGNILELNLGNSSQLLSLQIMCKMQLGGLGVTNTLRHYGQIGRFPVQS